MNASCFTPFIRIVLMLGAAMFTSCLAGAEESRGVITFAVDPGERYLPLTEAAKALRWAVEVNETGRCKRINGVEISEGQLRYLYDGLELVSGSFLARLGASDKCLTRLFSEPPGKKWVEINLAKQQLFAWQGSRLILQSRISSGRNGRTPAGEFRAGPFKARIHYSTRYHRAPMPWSVQINGNVFVHGFTSVPNYPASHGCIRLPLTGLNPAKLFFEWVDVGTPVRVTTG